MNRIAASLEGDPSGSSTAALQLLLVSSKLASWVHAPSHASLPSDLQHGPVLLLHRATENADSPHISSRLMDDTLVLLTYGVNYLGNYGDRALLLTRLENFRAQRVVDRASLHMHAQRIQMQFRCQRFGTHRLASLEFATHESLIPEVQERMRLGSPTSSDLTTAVVTVDNEELQVQIEKYAVELHARVEACKHAAELQRQRLQKKHREQEDLKKKQFYQKRRRHENACRRWNYFTGRLLRLHRDESHQEIQSRVEARRCSTLPTDQQPPTTLTRTNMFKRIDLSSCQVMFTTPSARHAEGAEKNWSKPAFCRTASSTLMKNALHRNFIRQFVAKAIARGLSRALCESNMSAALREKASAQPAPQQPEPTKNSDSSGPSDCVLRLGVLLCDVHFGAKYMGLYQRFLERAAREKGFATIEWQLFDCIKSQFPTQALQRVLHGFLVAGGPNNGANQAHSVPGGGADRPDTSESTTRSEDNYRATSKKSAGPWRKNLQKVLRQIYNDKRALLGGLGLGHVVLGEALGAKCGHRDWEDGWSVLDPKLFDPKTLEKPSTTGSGSSGSAGRNQSSSRYVGIKYLHGEFVQSMDFAPHGMKSWRSLDQSFISCFKDKWALSFDGFPECGTFVFETMGELYDREKAAAAITAPQQQQDPRSIALRRALIDGDDAFEPLSSSSRSTSLEFMIAQQKSQPPARRAGVIETVLTLEEKKKLLDVTDISQAVAHALVDHFQAAMTGNATRATPSIEGSTTTIASTAGVTEVAAVVNPIDCVDIEESIRLVAAAAAVPGDGVTAICFRVRSTLDGHLVVLGAQLDAFVRAHERRVRAKKRSSSVLQMHSTLNGFARKNSTYAGEDETLLLPLYTLRDQKLVLLDDNASPLSLSSNSSKSTVGGKQRTIVHLPIQLPMLNSSSSVAAAFEGDTMPSPLCNGANSSTMDSSQSSRKRPPQVVKRVKSSAIGVLTFSEALSRFQSEFIAAVNTRVTANHIVGNNNSQRQLQPTKASPPRVIIQFADEEASGSGSYQLQRKSNAELRQLWVRLVAALRVGEVSDDRVSILSRQICVLDFFRRRQPLWTLIKDCRRSTVLAPRHHVKRVSWYARYADTLLFDQEVLLSSSAKENEVLFQQARYYGLKVFVAREEKASAATVEDRDGTTGCSTRSLDDNRKCSSKRAVSMTQKPQRQSTFSGAGTLAKAAVDKDLQIVEILLLQLTGIDGVLTPTPEIANEATHKLRSKSPIMNQVEQLFRTWQVKGASSKSTVVLPKRYSLRNAGNGDDQLDEDNEDFMGDGTHDRDDDCLALDDKEVTLEMTWQYAEHGMRRPPSSAYVPLRPLQPKRGDQVLGAQQCQRSFPGDTITGNGVTGANEESPGTRLHSIGTFRTVFQRSQTVRLPPHLEGTYITQTLGDDRMTTRPAESVSGLSGMLQATTTQSPRVKRLNQQSAPR